MKRLVPALVIAAVTAAVAIPARLGASTIDVTLPQLAPCSLPIAGLGTCLSYPTDDASGQPMNAASPLKGAWAPDDLQAAYLYFPGGGSGITVAIVDAYRDPNAESDMNAYRKHYGIGTCTHTTGCFKEVNQSGNTSPLPRTATSASQNSWNGEISLDLDMVSAVCNGCNILLVDASSAQMKDLGAAVNAAADAGANVVSMSWTTPEVKDEVTRFPYFNHPNSILVAAAGDNGYGPLFPAAAQSVISVGGTVLKLAPNTPRGFTEVVWSRGIFDHGATGGGCSRFVAKPSWQTDTGCKKRLDNDISAVAKNLSVYDSVQSKSKPWISLNGTSAATPLIAGMYALAGAIPSATPSMYTAQSADFNDITSGSIGSCAKTVKYMCTAGPGYDGPSGFGTPSGLGAFTPASVGDCDNDGDPGDSTEADEC